MYSNSLIPRSIDDLPNSVGTSVTFDDLKDKFNEIEENIKSFKKNLVQRKNDMPELDLEHHRNCSLICEDKHFRNKEDKIRCIQNCSNAIVSFHSLKDLQNQFPIDVEQINSNTDLKKRLIRLQKDPESINEDSDHDMEKVVNLYTMPISVIYLPEKSWKHMLNVLQKPKHAHHLKKFSQNLYLRQSSYPPEVLNELFRKIEDYDKNQHIYNTMQNEIQKL